MRTDLNVGILGKSKKEKKAFKPPKALAASAGTDSGPTTNTTNADGAQFLRDARWAKSFIPTITHALYISHEPFRDWNPEAPTFLATVQNVFNISFTNVTFLLLGNDPIADTVRL